MDSPLHPLHDAEKEADILKKTFLRLTKERVRHQGW